MKVFLLCFMMISAMMITIACGSTGVEEQGTTVEVDTSKGENEVDVVSEQEDMTGEIVSDGRKEESLDGEDTSQVEVDTPVEAMELVENIVLPEVETDLVTEEMMTTGVIGKANLGRLAAAMRKASRGEEITVGVIGGSITQGSSTSSEDQSYAQRFHRWWVAAFPNTKINYVNAGIGATTSYLGVHRVDRDLLQYNPDVVVVEFSVNDSSSMFFKKTYEDLILKILNTDNNPAVISLFMTMEDGTSAQKMHDGIGFLYQLPRISYGNVVLAEIQKGTYTWQDISPDNIHPNDMGHSIAGELLWRYLNSVYEQVNTIVSPVEPISVDPFGDLAYIEGTFYDHSNITPVEIASYEIGSGVWKFPNNWISKTGEGSIVFEVEAMNVGILFQRTTNGLSGQFEVYVDGEYCRTLDGNFKDGWGDFSESIEVFRSDEKKVRRIEIKKASDSIGDQFNLIGLLIS